MTPFELAYRQVAAQGTTGLGLLIALYDTLAGDLRRAADAERNNNIQKRSDAVKHALLIVAHLEDKVATGSGGELASYLANFYSSLRRNMLMAQAKRSADILEAQITEVLKVRKIWQDIDLRETALTDVPAWIAEASFLSTGASQREHQPSAWTA